MNIKSNELLLLRVSRSIITKSFILHLPVCVRTRIGR